MFKIALSSLLCLIAANTVTAQTSDGTDQGYTIVNPTRESYPDEGIRLQETELQKMMANPGIAAAVPFTRDWIAYTYYRCSANWDQVCQGTLKVDAPPGWQACRALYSASGGRNSRHSVTPDNWYTNDPESPDRFRAYNFYIYAKGSGLIFDRWGSNMDLTNVGLRLISATATNKDRYIAGCEMPRHD